jgi:hypothetical protein
MFRTRIAWLIPLLLSIQFVLCSVACAQEERDSAAAVAAGESNKASVDPTGTWRFEYKFNDNAVAPVEGKLKLNWDGKNLTGKYTAFDRTSDIEEAELENDQLSFISKREFNGNEFVVSFDGKLKPDDIEGTVSFDFGDGEQEFDWNPKRVVEMDDVLGTWQLRVETANGIVEPRLTIVKEGKKLKGKSVSQVFGELEAKNLTLKDNTLSWEITGTTGGVEISVNYKGKPRGNTIEGENEFTAAGNSGTMKFTGKRTPPEEKEKPEREAKPGDEAATDAEPDVSSNQ